MKSYLGSTVMAGALLASVFGITPPNHAAEPSKTLRVGVVNSLFRGTPPSLVEILSRPLRALMESQTGMVGKMKLSGNADNLAVQLRDGKVELGFFHGFEFAWAKIKNPDLKPLLITVNKLPLVHVYLVIARDSKISSCADLKGQALSMPRLNREHCHLFLERRCPGGDILPKKFFSKIATPSDPEDALDDVIDGIVQATIVDQVSLDAFRHSKPERFAQLRILIKSELFPAGVIAYQPGKVDEETLTKFRTGMIAANRTTRGKTLLGMCRMTGFEAISADFEKSLSDIGKAYPPLAPPK